MHVANFRHVFSSSSTAPLIVVTNMIKKDTLKKYSFVFLPFGGPGGFNGIDV